MMDTSNLNHKHFRKDKNNPDFLNVDEDSIAWKAFKRRVQTTLNYSKQPDNPIDATALFNNLSSAAATLYRTVTRGLVDSSSLDEYSDHIHNELKSAERKKCSHASFIDIMCLTLRPVFNEHSIPINQNRECLAQVITKDLLKFIGIKKVSATNIAKIPD